MTSEIACPEGRPARTSTRRPDADVTAAFAQALAANNIEVEVVTVEGANHDNVVDPTTEVGQETLQAMADILTDTR